MENGIQESLVRRGLGRERSWSWVEQSSWKSQMDQINCLLPRWLSFSRYLLSINHMPGTVPKTGDNSSDQNRPSTAFILVRRDPWKKINKIGWFQIVTTPKEKYKRVRWLRVQGVLDWKVTPSWDVKRWVVSSLSSKKKVKKGHFRWKEIAKQSKGLARGRKHTWTCRGKERKP